ncbi:hypothetical protein ACN4EK_27195 [Pantanalinema rosaneae CENA516]|uniref:hypothetical protein n=1 Tax=Pantanalinema rosaneae TaxID=1620701 RepID=UPI003D6E107A
MAVLPNQNRSWQWVALLCLSGMGLGTIAPVAIAHNVEVSGDVAVTMHLEPNHNPKAGEPALIWFALTRQGGELIPLAQCDCRLAIYPEPRSPETTPVLQPTLTAIAAERYQGIPGTEVVFPQSGIYRMTLSGAPQAEANFPPFEVSYPVTVTAGSSRSTSQPQSVQPTPVATTSTSEPATAEAMPGWQISMIASILAIGLGIAAIPIKYSRRK